ncbi:uncharacterized protein METZ01_LOCUS450846 [marine metagenome]|uniref:Uncharacterized protein n=1 Tax=marine metagenome TaxID=408172 RepID=A0A382ZRA6_9ZZZZ
MDFSFFRPIFVSALDICLNYYYERSVDILIKIID